MRGRRLLTSPIFAFLIRDLSRPACRMRGRRQEILKGAPLLRLTFPTRLPYEGTETGLVREVNVLPVLLSRPACRMRGRRLAPRERARFGSRLSRPACRTRGRRRVVLGITVEILNLSRPACRMRGREKWRESAERKNVQCAIGQGCSFGSTVKAR